jgi:hypothetical protein
MKLRLSNALFVLVVSATLVAAQFIPIDVDDPRPVEKVIERIEAHCQCVITYEDPAYTMDQLVDLTRVVRKDGRSEPKIFGLPTRFMSFHYDPADKVETNIELALQQARRDGAAFRLTRSRDVFHVIPEAGSVLTVQVSGVLKAGTALDVIRSILNNVSQTRGVQIGLFGGGNLLMNTRVTLPSDSGSADQMLLAVWAQLAEGIKLTWKLLYDGQQRFYVLNMMAVKKLEQR